MQGNFDALIDLLRNGYLGFLAMRTTISTRSNAEERGHQPELIGMKQTMDDAGVLLLETGRESNTSIRNPWSNATWAQLCVNESDFLNMQRICSWQIKTSHCYSPWERTHYRHRSLIFRSTCALHRTRKQSVMSFIRDPSTLHRAISTHRNETSDRTTPTYLTVESSNGDLRYSWFSFESSISRTCSPFDSHGWTVSRGHRRTRRSVDEANSSAPFSSRTGVKTK